MIKKICLGLVILIMVGSAFLVWPRLQYRSGMRMLKTGTYDQAVSHLSRSLVWLSMPVVSQVYGLDRFRVRLGNGPGALPAGGRTMAEVRGNAESDKAAEKGKEAS